MIFVYGYVASASYVEKHKRKGLFFRWAPNEQLSRRSSASQDIVVFEKNLFGRYSDWSPELKHLLQNGDEIIKFQRRAYALFKEKFEPGLSRYKMVIQDEDQKQRSDVSLNKKTLRNGHP